MRSRESQASGREGQTVTPLDGRARVSQLVRHILSGTKRCINRERIRGVDNREIVTSIRLMCPVFPPQT